MARPGPWGPPRRPTPSVITLHEDH